MTEFKCTVCGGKDVQEKYWVNINTFAIVDPVEQEEDANKTWCNDCEAHVEAEEVQLKSDSNLLDEIDSETEHLETTEGDSVECISIENLKGILKRHGIITN